MVEQLTRNEQARGSSPLSGSDQRLIGACFDERVAGIAISNRSSDNKDPSLAFSAPPPSGEEIRVTPDSIQFGDGLVGSGRFAELDGRTYVVAGHFDAKNDPHYDSEQSLWWFRPKTAVLVAFDEDGVERWRTELKKPPSQVVAVAGNVWLAYADGTLSRIDPSNGRVVDRANIGENFSMVGAFGSVWVQTGNSPGSLRLIRVNADFSTRIVKLPDRVLYGDYSATVVDPPKAGPAGIWVPLGEGGVAVVDPVTLDVTVISAKAIGHEVKQVAFDGDAAYVANDYRVTSIVDERVVATTLASGHNDIAGYLGSIDGVLGFGELRSDALFRVLRRNDPMVVETRQLATEEQTGSAYEIDGETWMETGRNYNLRRVRLLPVPAGTG